MFFPRFVQTCALAAALAAMGVTAQAQPADKQSQQKHDGKHAQMDRFDGMAGRWWNNPKVAEQLKLTDEQRKSFDAILLQHRETLIDLHANLEKAELGMEPLMRDDQPNEGKIVAQIDKVAQARAELEKAHARFLLALRSKLTPAQWKQVQALRAEHRAGAGPMGPGGCEGRPGGPGGPGGDKKMQHGARGGAPMPPPPPPPAQ